jgi:hypothetical protein
MLKTSIAGPCGVLSRFPAATTTEVEDVDGEPPGGCCREFRQRPPPKLKTSMVGSLGVLAAGLVVATTEVEDVDGSPPGGAVGSSGSGHHRS